MNGQCMATCMAVTLGFAVVAFGEMGARSGFVPMIAPGDAFAPVNATMDASADTVDTDVVFEAVRTEDFTVDGDLTKPVWRKARPIPSIARKGQAWPAELKSDIRFLYSTNAIYVAATLWQDMSKVVCKWDQRDMPVWNDDNLELFMLLKTERGQDLYQYAVNPLGTIADLRNENRAYWTRGMKIKANRHPDRWTFELRIPFAGVPMDRPISGEGIALRVCRTVHSLKAMGQVPMLLSGGHCQIKRFAKLLFLPPDGSSRDAIQEEKAFRDAMIAKRIAAREAAFKKRFAEIRGAAAAFGDSKHPLVAEALAGVRQMEKSLEKGFDPAMAAGFEKYASRYAYAVWQGSLWDRASPAELPPDDARTMPKPILVEQAGNEREAVCLCLMGLLCGNRLDVRIVPEGVKAAAGRRFLSPDAIEIYYEPFVKIDNETWTYPLVRAAGNMVPVSPGMVTRVWVMFNSRGVTAGDYQTKLHFKCAYSQDVDDRSLAMRARVWSFDLPETRDWPLKSFFWGSFAYRQNEVDWLELMHDYHVTHGWTQLFRLRYGMYDDNGYYTSPGKGAGKADPEHDFEDEIALHGNQEFLRRAKELGMRFVIGWSTPFSLDWYKTVTKRFLDMGFGYEDFVFHGMLKDEFAKADIPKHAAKRKQIHDWNTNLVFAATYLSTPPPTGATLEDIKENGLDEFFRLWWLINGRCLDKEKGPPMISHLKSKGRSVWTYNCLMFMHNKDMMRYYRLYPWTARMLGLDGFAFWVSTSPKGLDGWDSRDGYDDGIAWRGLDKRNVPTRGLEAVREGLEDVAYMDRLEKELARAGKGRFPEYEKLLADREAVVARADPAEVGKWRLSAGRAIDALVKSGASVTEHVIHRGWGLGWPENSLAAVERCWEAGFIPEVDGRISKDGVCYVFHDSSHKGRPVSEMTWNEIRAIDIGEKKGAKWKGTHPPMLADLFARMAGHPDRRIALDYKSIPNATLHKLAVKYGVERQIYFCTGSYPHILDWLKYVPDAPSVMWFYGGSWKTLDFNDRADCERREAFMKNSLDAVAANGYKGLDLVELIVYAHPTDPTRFCPSAEFIKAEFERIRAAGKKPVILVWSEGDKESTYRNLAPLKPDFFGTDYPEALERYLR